MFFVEPGDGTGVVADRLADWYRRNAADVAVSPDALPERLRALLAAIADAGAKPEEAPGYWECFASLAALGWTDAAVDLAALHSCWEEWRVGKASARPMAELLEAAVALVRTAPRLGRADVDPSDDETRRTDADDGHARAGESPATSVPQFMAFREAWTRQIRDVLADATLFDACGDVAAAEGVRAALSAMLGDETAVARAAPGGWLERTVAEARCRYPLARAAGDHAAIARRCVAARGPGASEEMDRLLLAAVEADDAAAVVAACAAHLDAWFLAHLAEMLVAAAGEGHRVGRADPHAGALRREGAALAGGGFRPGSGAAVTARDAPTGAVLRRPTATLRGGNQAELYLVEYCAGARARPKTRGLALRYAARAATRGASLAAATLRASAPIPGFFAAAAETRERDPDGAFAATFEVLETCHAMGLPAVAVGVARAAAADARAGAPRDGLGAAAWVRRVGDVRGGRGGGGGAVADAGDGRDGPGRGGGDDRTTRRGTPRERGRARCVGMGRIRGVCGVGARARVRRVGTRRFLDAAAALRARDEHSRRRGERRHDRARRRRGGVARHGRHGATRGGDRRRAPLARRGAKTPVGGFALSRDAGAGGRARRHGTGGDTAVHRATGTDRGGGGHDARRSGGTGDDARVGHGGGSARRRGEERVGKGVGEGVRDAPGNRGGARRVGGGASRMGGARRAKRVESRSSC